MKVIKKREFWVFCEKNGNARMLMSVKKSMIRGFEERSHSSYKRIRKLTVIYLREIKLKNYC